MDTSGIDKTKIPIILLEELDKVWKKSDYRYKSAPAGDGLMQFVGTNPETGFFYKITQYKDEEPAQ